MMRTTGRTRLAGSAAGALMVLSLVLFAGAASAQGTVTVLTEGMSDELIAPPSPNCDGDSLVLIPETAFTADGRAIDVPRLGVGSSLELSYDIPDFPELEPGTIEISEIITFDGQTSRGRWPVQDNERVAVEFLLNGDVQVTTEFTPDLADSVNVAWVASNLGTYELPEGADAARIVHFNDDNQNDSVLASSLCAVFTAGEATDDSVASTDADEDDEMLSLAELIERAAAASDGDELALTGANEIAFAVIALGVILFGIAFRVRAQNPQDLIY